MLKIKSNKFVQELMGIIFKYVGKLYYEALIEFDRKEDEIYIQKNVFSVVDGFIACIGSIINFLQKM